MLKKCGPWHAHVSQPQTCRSYITIGMKFEGKLAHLIDEQCFLYVYSLLLEFGPAEFGNHELYIYLHLHYRACLVAAGKTMPI